MKTNMKQDKLKLNLGNQCETLSSHRTNIA